MKKSLLALIFMMVGTFFMQHTAGALSLKVAPLEYRTSLSKGEKKKGYIDISNPTTEKMTVTTSVQAFKQIDDEGTIQFYDDEALTAGVRLDLDKFELGPREALRMYFLLDSTKLPSGDVFGAIFFTTSPVAAKAGVGQAVKLGTILSLVNGTPGSREATISGLDVPFFNFSSQVQGSYTISNTADPSGSTGFYPQVKLSTAPVGDTKEQAGKLVFAGRSRTNSFSVDLPPLGIYRIEAKYGNSSHSRWVFVMTPLALTVIIILLVLVSVYHRLQRRRLRGFRIKRS
jgi:hypothetical protein